MALAPPAGHALIGISAMGYYLPPTQQSIGYLVESGRINSSADKLNKLGFESIRIAGEESAVQLAVQAVRNLQLRSGFDFQRIDVLLYAGALATEGQAVRAGSAGLVHENHRPSAVD